jgi:hypothetical protein
MIFAVGLSAKFVSPKLSTTERIGLREMVCSAKESSGRNVTGNVPVENIRAQNSKVLYATGAA